MKKKTATLLSVSAATGVFFTMSAQGADGHHNHDHAAHHGHSSKKQAQNWSLELKAPVPVTKNVQTELQMHLRDDSGTLVAARDLALAHERKLHFLIVDETLSDYHHLHPVEKAPGEFVTTFVPRLGGRYIAFADVADAETKTQRYVRGEIRSAGDEPKADDTVKHEAIVDGYRFELRLSHHVTTAGGAHAVVRITAPDGSPVQNLEPIMGAFAHGVGFSKNLQSVLHVHPHGPEPVLKDERAGPEIAFHLNPDQSGFFRVYVQVRVDGRALFAPFGIHVEQ